MSAMALYSSSLDPRHYLDSEANNLAFIEFIVALMFGHSVKVSAGSLFDCLPLHNIWHSYYPSFVKFSDYYAAHKIKPLTITIDQRRFPYGNENDIPYKIAHGYLSGEAANEDKKSINIPSGNFEFLVLGVDEIENARSNSRFLELKSGRIEALSNIRNVLFLESLEYLNRYCNSFKPYEFSNSPNLDLLSVYMKGCNELSDALLETSPSISRELKEGIRAIAGTSPELRRSTATLIRVARRHFPTTFDPIVVPLSRALNSQTNAQLLQADISINYEAGLIKDYSIFRAACNVLDKRQRQTSDNFFFQRKTLKISDSSYKGKLATAFNWNAFHEIIFDESNRKLLNAVRIANTELTRAQAIEKYATAISRELIDLLSMRIESQDGHSAYLSVGLKSDYTIVNYVVKIVDKALDYVPLPPDFVKKAIERPAMKDALLTICPVVGSI